MKIFSLHLGINFNNKSTAHLMMEFENISLRTSRAHDELEKKFEWENF